MASQEGCSTKKAPLFIGTNYAFQKVRMKTYLISLRIEVWSIVLMGCEEPKETTSDKDAKMNFIANAKAMNALLSGLCESQFIKVMHCETAKDVWDKLENIYEGDKKVKMTKLQVYRTQFETLKMNEDEDIAKLFLRIDEFVNIMLVVGETINESVIVQKKFEVVTF